MHLYQAPNRNTFAFSTSILSRRNFANADGHAPHNVALSVFRWSIPQGSVNIATQNTTDNDKVLKIERGTANLRHIK